jgi:peptide/nickel transport system substrate-binding protein
MKKLLAIVLMLCMVFAFAACGNGGTDIGGDPSGSPSGGATGTTGGDLPSKESIVVAAAAEPDSFFPFNPDNMTNMDEVPILHNVYETPIKLMPDGSHEPLLALSWDISPDGKDYTLNLRDDVYFHNGDKMTAEDVAFSLNGAAETPGGRTLLINYDNAEVIDETTVVVHLTDPYAPFLNSLASRFALVVNKALFDEIGIDGYDAAPVGTGPYKFVQRIAGDHLTLEANDEYWGEKPAITNIKYQVMTDANTQMLALENGEIDVLLNANISPLLQLPESSGVKYLSTEAANIAAMMINCTKGPGTDPDFRKALQSGINREELILGVYEGMTVPTDIYMASSFSGRLDDGTYQGITYDPDKARQYLEASNYNGEEFMIATVAGTRNEVASQIVQGQLIELGINCTVNALDAASFMALAFYGTGEYGATLRAGGVSVLDADGLYTLFHPDVRSEGQYVAYPDSEELDRIIELVAMGRVESDPEARKEIYAEACDIINKEAYLVNLYCDLSVVAFNEAIRGVVTRSLVGLYYFNDWS